MKPPYVVLVRVDDIGIQPDGSIVPRLTSVSCATCRWAVPVTQDDLDSYTALTERTFDTYNLACRFREEKHDESWWPMDDPRVRSGVLGWSEGGERATLIVRPGFGCVQWEGKV